MRRNWAVAHFLSREREAWGVPFSPVLLSPVLMKLPTHAIRPMHYAELFIWSLFLCLLSVLTTLTDVAVSLRQMSNRLTIAGEGS
jgi:hypothetical protein